MTRIGKPLRTYDVPGVPVPVRIKPIKIPKKEPVPVRPQKEPDKKVWRDMGFKVTEIPYSCPICGEELEMEEEVLYCPKHGMVMS